LASAAFHVTITRESPPRITNPVGALGTVAGIAELLSSDALDDPYEFLATTVTVYKVPFSRPVIAQVFADAPDDGTSYVQDFPGLPTTDAT
jgi:hypothetical protein